MQATLAPRGDAQTFLTYFVGGGCGLEDDRYVIQRFVFKADGQIIPVHPDGATSKGAGRAERSAPRRRSRRAAAPTRRLCAGCGEARRAADRAKYDEAKSAGLAYGGRDPKVKQRSSRQRSYRRHRDEPQRIAIEWTQAGNSPTPPRTKRRQTPRWDLGRRWSPVPCRRARGLHRRPASVPAQAGSGRKERRPRRPRCAASGRTGAHGRSSRRAGSSRTLKRPAPSGSSGSEIHRRGGLDLPAAGHAAHGFPGWRGRLENDSAARTGGTARSQHRSENAVRA